MTFDEITDETYWARNKFFYLERKGYRYYLALTDGRDGIIYHDGQSVVEFETAEGALKALQAYNRRNGTEYLLMSRI